MSKDKALRLALEVMKRASDAGYSIECEEAITAVEAALLSQSDGEAKDEPVAQGSIQHLKIMMEESAWEGRIELSDVLANIDEFYTTPPQQEAKDEPVVGTKTWFEDGKVVTQNLYYSDVYTTPTQRKPLTDEEINALDYSGTRIEFVRAIEAAHGIKGQA